MVIAELAKSVSVVTILLVKNVRRVRIQACGLELRCNACALMPAAMVFSIRWRLIQAGHVSQALGVFNLSGFLCNSLLAMVFR